MLTGVCSEPDPELTRPGRQLEQQQEGRNRLGQVHSLPSHAPAGQGHFARPESVNLGPSVSQLGPGAAQARSGSVHAGGSAVPVLGNFEPVQAGPRPGQTQAGPGHGQAGTGFVPSVPDPIQVGPGQAQAVAETTQAASLAAQPASQVPVPSQLVPGPPSSVPGPALAVSVAAPVGPGPAQAEAGEGHVGLSHIQLGPGHEQAGPGRNFQRFVIGQSPQGNRNAMEVEIHFFLQIVHFEEYSRWSTVYQVMRTGFRYLVKQKNLRIYKDTCSVRGASKIKVKSIYKKRMATARRLIFFGVSQGVHC